MKTPLLKPIRLDRIPSSCGELSAMATTHAHFSDHFSTIFLRAFSAQRERGAATNKIFGWGVKSEQRETNFYFSDDFRFSLIFLLRFFFFIFFFCKFSKNMKRHKYVKMHGEIVQHG